MSDHPELANTPPHVVPSLTDPDMLSGGRLSAVLSCPNCGEAAADQLQRIMVLGLLSAEVAHEINNLTALVVGSLELLRPEQLSGRGQELLRRAEWGAQQVGRLTRQALSFAHRDMPRQPVDVNDVVGGFDTIMALIAGTNVEIDVILTREPVMACLEPGQLQLALLNLVRNAADALTGNRGRIWIETRRHTTLTAGATVEVLVADTGPGMPAAIAQHATDPFFSTKAPERGTGLGLWLVNQFVESCGGKLAIETVVGRGTKVRLLFPQTS